MPGQEGFKRLRPTGGTRQAKAGSEEQAVTGKISAMAHRSCQYESGQELAHHYAIHIRKVEVTTEVAVGEFERSDAELVQHVGVANR
jgi:hypothetical protein